jgi:hypothetical protein
MKKTRVLLCLLPILLGCGKDTSTVKIKYFEQKGLKVCFLRFVDIATIRNGRNQTYVDKVRGEEAPRRGMAVLISLENVSSPPIRLTLVDSILWTNNYSFGPNQEGENESRRYDFFIPEYLPPMRSDTLYQNEKTYLYLPMAKADDFVLNMPFDQLLPKSIKETGFSMYLRRLDSTNTNYDITLRD